MVTTSASALRFDPPDSALMTLSPPILETLEDVVPTRRRAKLSYIVGLGVLAVVGAVGANRSTREFITERWHPAGLAAPRAAAPPPVAEPAIADRTVPPTVMSNEPIADPVVAAPSTTASGSGTAAIPKKMRRHRGAPHPQEKRTSSSP